MPKVGDKIKYVNGSTSMRPGREMYSKIHTVKCIDLNSKKIYLGDRNEDGYQVGTTCPCGNHRWEVRPGDYEITESTSMTSLSLKDKFALAFKGEPERSFIRAGVMNTDESLTKDGESLFLAYLLKKNGDDFKKEVVDPILAEEDKNAGK